MTTPRTALVALLIAPALGFGCTKTPKAWAGRIQSRSDLIGGPRALGEIGDYRLHNGRVRFIVQDVGTSRGFGTFGGSLIDADLNRGDERADPHATTLPGRDGLAELFPAFFLAAVEPTQVKVLDDGSGDGAACGGPPGTACLRVIGKTSEFLTATSFIDQATLGSGLTFFVDYKLGPADDYLSITATVANGRPESHVFPIGQFPVPFGFISLFGDGQPLFLNGEAGYDVRFSLARSYKRPYQLPAFPGITADIVATEGNGVSYGLSFVPDASPGYVYKHRDQYEKYGAVQASTMLVPFVSGSFVGVYMAEPPAVLAGGASFSYTARLRLGDGSASSVIDAQLRDTNTPTGLLTGIVREERSEQPVPYADVVVLSAQKPAGCADCGSLSGAAVTTARADQAGRFHALLPPGDYVAVARLAPRPNGVPQLFSVALGKPSYLEPHVGRAALLAVDVSDETGRRVPAKVTLDAAYGPEHAGQDPRTFLYDFRIGDPYRPTDLIPDTDDPETRRYVEAVFRATDGRAQGAVRPGLYRVTVSRGPAYTLDVQDVALDPGTLTHVSAVVRRVLPASGRVAADLHVHTIGSIDSDVTYEDRVASYAAEGIDYLVATDHNLITDLRPTVHRMGLEDFVQTTTGLELTSLEAGHWNGFPLAYDPGPVRHYNFDWFRRKPQELFDDLRANGRYGPDDTVVQVNHPRDSVQGYFTSYGLIGDALNADPLHDTPPRQGSFVPRGKGFEPGDFSLDFDAVEILTGKRFDLMRTFRVPEQLPPPPLPATVGPPGSILRDKTGAVAFPGALEDWMHLLDAGLRVTAVGNSDSHKLLDGEGGYPRNLVDLGHGWQGAAQLDEREIARAIKAGRVMVTTAPEITLAALDPASGARGEAPVELPPGALVVPDAAGTVRVRVVVKAAPWVDVTRVSLLLPGGQTVAVPLGPPSADGVTRLDAVRRVRVPDGRDSWIAAQVEGDRSLYPVVVPFEIPPLLLNDAVGAVGAGLGLGDEFGNLKPQLVTRVMPFALANPILVDGNGDGKWGLQRPKHARAGPALEEPNPLTDARPVDLRAMYREWVAH